MLDEQLDGRVNPVNFVALFRRAFDVPFGVARRAAEWHGPHTTGGQVGDEEFVQLLAPWG